MELATQRLRLRPPEPADLADVISLRTDPEARRWLGGPMPPEAIRRQFEHARHSWMLGEPSLMVIRLHEDDAFVGVAGPWGMFGRSDAEVLWELAPDRWGHGYATEATSAVLDWLFRDLGWPQAHFFIAPGNRASLGVARRLGAQVVREREARAPHRRPGDLALACRRETWLAGVDPASDPPWRARGGSGMAASQGVRVG